MEKKFLETLRGKVHSSPPIWLMRQAGRYLPEYMATRKKAGGFLDLCYNSDLSTEVTLQPIRRFDFDAAILFADILLLPHALGMDLWFESGEGPRLNGILNGYDINTLKPISDIHETLNPIYQTVKNLSEQLPAETTLIGFAGARVIKQTIGQDLPKGFQTSEFLLKKGFIDQVLHRKEMKLNISNLISILK